MKPNIIPMLDRIHRIYAPGMEQFYCALPQDLWTKVIDDMEAMLTTGDDDVTIRALAIYKAKLERMLEIYKSYMELTQESYPTNPVIEAICNNLWLEANEQTTRRTVRCDRCEYATERAGPITIETVDTINKLGDPVTKWTAVCSKCKTKEGPRSAGSI